MLLEAARQADIILIGSEDAHLHPDYLALINRLCELHPTIAILLRSPYDAVGIREDATVIGAYTHTPDAMEAIALVLSGKLQPHGRLPLHAL